MKFEIKYIPYATPDPTPEKTALERARSDRAFGEHIRRHRGREREDAERAAASAERAVKAAEAKAAKAAKKANRSFSGCDECGGDMHTGGVYDFGSHDTCYSCRSASGTGTVSKPDVCSDCGGSGYIDDGWDNPTCTSC